nr:Protein T12G3.2, isoform b [Haemonchus contortus]
MLDGADDPVKSLLNQLVCACEKKIENLDQEASSSATFTVEWTRLTWSLLAVISRLSSRFIDPRHVDQEEQELTKRLNIKLFDLINKARPARPPPGMMENDFRWMQFYNLLVPTLTTLHDLYSQLDTPMQSLDSAIATFTEAQIPCIGNFLASESCSVGSNGKLPRSTRGEVADGYHILHFGDVHIRDSCFKITGFSLRTPMQATFLNVRSG